MGTHNRNFMPHFMVMVFKIFIYMCDSPKQFEPMWFGIV